MPLDHVVDDLCWRFGFRRHHRALPSRWKMLPTNIAEWCNEHLPMRWHVEENTAFFKHAGDLALFSLHWSEEIAEAEARDRRVAELLADTVYVHRSIRTAAGIAE